MCHQNGPVGGIYQNWRLGEGDCQRPGVWEISDTAWETECLFSLKNWASWEEEWWKWVYKMIERIFIKDFYSYKTLK